MERVRGGGSGGVSEGWGEGWSGWSEGGVG